MAQQTEAACLLESGALYAKRLLLRAEVGDPVFAGFKCGAFSLYFGDAPIVHFDLEGRWQRAFIAGIHYLKGLETTIQSIDRVREGANLVLKRRTLAFAEASDVDAFVWKLAVDLADQIDGGRLETLVPPDGSKAQPLALEELRDFLEGVVAWDASAWFAHRERYQATYGPLPMLPPDCPSAVVLDGSRCGNAGDFERHVRGVAALLGRRVEQCRSVFLARADVLRRSVDEVAAYLETATRIFPIDSESGNGARPRTLDGFSAYLDDLAAPLPDRKTWIRLRALGLKRVSLGVESGEPGIRRIYGKEWSDDDLRDTVSALKAAGIGVGVIVAVGAGGSENAAIHLDATAGLLCGLDLGPGDLVSLLDADELSALGGTSLEVHKACTPMHRETRANQLEALRTRLAPIRTVRGAKVAPFWPEKQGV